METALLEYTATALVEEYVFPLAKYQKRRTRVFLALVIFILLITFYLFRSLFRVWCRRTPAHVLSHWEHFTVSLYDRRIVEHRHDQAVRSAWSFWSILRNRINRNEVGVTWREWSAVGNRIRHHAWHLDDRHRRARQNRRG